MGKTAILHHNLGGPSTEDEVRPFLERLFSDPEILRLPFSKLLQRPLARLIARRRAPHARANYRAIGGGSPVLGWTRRQGEGMRIGLAEHLPDEEVRVFPAMRYSEPLVADAVAGARAWGATRILSFTLYPQYSTTTTGSSERELERCLRRLSWQPDLVKISQWSDDPGYLDCMAWRVQRAIERLPAEWRDETHIVYSAHGIPCSVVAGGDPYVDQVERTVAAIGDRLHADLPASLAYQSRLGPMKWTEPDLTEHVAALAKQGCRSILVVAVSFVSDHVETLYELDIEVRQLAEAAGIEHWARAPALNADPDFLGVLTRLAAKALAPSAAPAAR